MIRRSIRSILPLVAFAAFAIPSVAGAERHVIRLNDSPDVIVIRGDGYRVYRDDGRHRRMMHRERDRARAHAKRIRAHARHIARDVQRDVARAYRNDLRLRIRDGVRRDHVIRLRDRDDDRWDELRDLIRDRVRYRVRDREEWSL